MEKRTYLTILYDYYSGLLNERQKEYFESYYFNNLTLKEISENLNISRNAVHKTIKKVEEKLECYEKILKMYERGLKLSNIIEKIDNNEIKNEIKDLEY